MIELRVPARVASGSLAVIGIWFALLVPFHPNIIDDDLAAAVRDDRLWQLTHTVMFFVGFAGVLATAHIVHRASAGRIGSMLLAVTAVSGVATACAGMVEAAAFPLFARRAPELISYDGPLFASGLFRAFTGPWLLFPLCLAALGGLAYRGGVQRNAGLALAIAGVAFFALGMWFVPFVGPLSSLALGLVLLWWAALLWSSTPEVAADPSL